MSMIHDQMWRLKATAKRLDASGDRDAAREIYLAVETINDLHTKLTAAGKELLEKPLAEEDTDEHDK